MSKHGIKVIQIRLRMTLTAAVSICSLLDLPSSLCVCVCVSMCVCVQFWCICLCVHALAYFLKAFFFYLQSTHAVQYHFCHLHQDEAKAAVELQSFLLLLPLCEKNESVVVHTASADLTLIYRYEQLSR